MNLINGIDIMLQNKTEFNKEQHHRNIETEHKQIIDDAREYIRLNSTKKISLKHVAKNVYISHSYLSLLLKRYTGKGYCHMFHSIRLEEATSLIRNTNKSLAEIAFLTGYTDYSYFAKVFNKHTGMTPKGYRQSQEIENCL